MVRSKFKKGIYGYFMTKLNLLSKIKKSSFIFIVFMLIFSIDTSATFNLIPIKCKDSSFLLKRINNKVEIDFANVTGFECFDLVANVFNLNFENNDVFSFINSMKNLDEYLFRDGISVIILNFDYFFINENLYATEFLIAIREIFNFWGFEIKIDVSLILNDDSIRKQIRDYLRQL